MLPVCTEAPLVPYLRGGTRPQLARSDCHGPYTSAPYNSANPFDHVGGATCGLCAILLIDGMLHTPGGKAVLPGLDASALPHTFGEGLRGVPPE